MSDLIGREIIHDEYGWVGRIGYGSTEDAIMVIWPEHQGASLWAPESLRWPEESLPERE